MEKLSDHLLIFQCMIMYMYFDHVQRVHAWFYACLCALVGSRLNCVPSKKNLSQMKGWSLILDELNPAWVWFRSVLCCTCNHTRQWCHGVLTQPAVHFYITAALWDVKPLKESKKKGPLSYSVRVFECDDAMHFPAANFRLLHRLTFGGTNAPRRKFQHIFMQKTSTW